MNWFSHRVFAVGVAAMCKFDVIGIGAAYLGSTLPDSIDFFQVKMGANFNRIHRKHSHAWIWYALILGFVYYFAYPFLLPYLPKKIQTLADYRQYILAFFLGIFSHLFLDMLTIKGVPKFINPNKKIALKLVTTHSRSEHIFTFVFFVGAGMYLYITGNPYVNYFINFVMKYI